MSWFILALIATFGWGFADLFYKKGTDENDRHSHLKIAVWVAIIMGITSAVLLLFSKETHSAKQLLVDAVKYSPASFGYIISMIIGYAGMRYLEISIISPVQNASGALSSAVMIIFFLFSGRIKKIRDTFSAIDIVGILAIVIGVILLAIAENKISAKEEMESKGYKKHRMGALALIFPLLYCLFDTVGTAADGIILDEKTGLNISEITVLILYGFTFALAGIFAYLFVIIKERRFYNPFMPKEIKTKGVAALCEEFGQIFYVYAMASNPVLAAPMIASYCIVSVVLSRILLKEKLKLVQYLSVCIVIVGIVLLGISEGLAEA